MTAGLARQAEQVSNPVFARIFPTMSRAMEVGGMAAHRDALLAELTGQVIEVGAGTGASFGHYPPVVDQVIAIEPEPRLRQLATAAAAAAHVPVMVTDGLASALPAPAASFDAAVATFVLCTVPDQAAPLREIRRVIKPGGPLCFLEHVRADNAGLTRMQRALDATVWPHLFGGCHLGRDTAARSSRLASASAGSTVSCFPRPAPPSRSTSPARRSGATADSFPGTCPGTSQACQRSANAAKERNSGYAAHQRSGRGPLAALASDRCGCRSRRCVEVGGQPLEVDAAGLQLKPDRVGPARDEAERGQLPAAAAAQLDTERIAGILQHAV